MRNKECFLSKNIQKTNTQLVMKTGCENIKKISQRLYNNQHMTLTKTGCEKTKNFTSQRIHINTHHVTETYFEKAELSQTADTVNKKHDKQLQTQQG